jgi:hypothetical protein
MLAIYKSDTPETLVADENPIVCSHDVCDGSWYTQKLYIRNSDSNVYYTDITIGLSLEENPTSNGHLYMLFPGDIEPTALEWSMIHVNNSITLSEIGSEGSGDTTTYVPFFLRTYLPAQQSTGYVTEVSLVIYAIEEPV